MDKLHFCLVLLLPIKYQNKYVILTSPHYFRFGFNYKIITNPIPKKKRNAIMYKSNKLIFYSQ